MFTLSNKTTTTKVTKPLEDLKLKKYQKIKNLLILEYKHLELMQKTYIRNNKEYNLNKVSLDDLRKKLEEQKENIIIYKEQHEKLKQKFLTLEVFSDKESSLIPKEDDKIISEKKLNTERKNFYDIPKHVHEPEKDYFKSVNNLIYVLLAIIAIMFFAFMLYSHFRMNSINDSKITISSPVIIEEKVIENILIIDSINEDIAIQEKINDKYEKDSVVLEVNEDIDYSNSKLAKRVISVESENYNEGFYVVVASCRNKSMPLAIENEDAVIIETNNKFRYCVPIFGENDAIIKNKLNKFRLEYDNAWLLFVKN